MRYPLLTLQSCASAPDAMSNIPSRHLGPYLALHGASDRIDDGLWYAGEMPSSRIPMDSTCEIIGLKDEDARHAAGHRASSLRSSGSRVSARDPVAQLLACVIVGKV